MHHDDVRVSVYSEADLVQNRASVLVYGGSEADRRAWADEVAQRLTQGALVEVGAGPDLDRALERKSGVVFIRDLTQLSSEAQGKLVRCLVERDEQPKFIVALPMAPDTARTKGQLREDLAFRLARARVDLSDPALKEAIRVRREKAKTKKSKSR